MIKEKIFLFVFFLVMEVFYFHLFVSESPPKDGFAVIVWLHSGDFVNGNSSEFSPFQLVFKQKVIIVTVAFRLGVFGFFTTNDGEAPGNYGLMDQSAALLWINTNIHLFNGNAKNVCLMGHGSGAVSVSLHLTSGEWSKDLFHKAIIMSGTSISSTYVRDPKSLKNEISRVAETFACSPQTSAMLTCLRRVDATLFMESIPQFDWTPIIDDRLSNATPPFIPDDPKVVFERQLVQKVPVLIGFTNMEDILDVAIREMLENGLSNEMYTTLTTEVIRKDITQLEMNNETTCSEGGGLIDQPILEAMDFAYKPYFTSDNQAEELRKKYIDFVIEKTHIAPTFWLAKALSKNSEVFMYRFDTKPKTQVVVDMLPTWAGVPHGLDQIFLWGMPYWVTLDNQTQWVAEDKRLSDIIMTMWANFAKFSNPTELGVYIRWNNFTNANPSILLIDRSFNMSDTTTLNYQGVYFWNDYYPKVIDFASQCCNITSRADSLIANASYILLLLLVKTVLNNKLIFFWTT